jgi:hypothetical protein
MRISRLAGEASARIVVSLERRSEPVPVNQTNARLLHLLERAGGAGDLPVRRLLLVNAVAAHTQFLCAA